MDPAKWEAWAGDMLAGDRPRAEWDACVAIVANIAHYHPVGVAYTIPDSLRGLHGFASREERERFIHTTPDHVRDFGAWREHVTFTEGQNAAKLCALWCTIVVLSKFADHELVRAMRLEIEQFLIGRWKIRDQVPADWRSEAMRRSRRYDLLPKEWRSL